MKYFIVFAAFFLFVNPAFACAMLESAEPKVGSEVAASPARITLHFSGKIIVPASTLEVRDAAGNIVSQGKPVGDAQDDSIIAVALKPLPPGKYKVSWNTLCDCGSYTPGDYKFVVK